MECRFDQAANPPKVVCTATVDAKAFSNAQVNGDVTVSINDELLVLGKATVFSIDYDRLSFTLPVNPEALEQKLNFEAKVLAKKGNLSFKGQATVPAIKPLVTSPAPSVEPPKADWRLFLALWAMAISVVALTGVLAGAFFLWRAGSLSRPAALPDDPKPVHPGASFGAQSPPMNPGPPSPPSVYFQLARDVSNLRESFGTLNGKLDAMEGRITGMSSWQQHLDRLGSADELKRLADILESPVEPSAMPSEVPGLNERRLLAIWNQWQRSRPREFKALAQMAKELQLKAKPVSDVDADRVLRDATITDYQFEAGENGRWLTAEGDSREEVLLLPTEAVRVEQGAARGLLHRFFDGLDSAGESLRFGVAVNPCVLKSTAVPGRFRLVKKGRILPEGIDPPADYSSKSYEEMRRSNRAAPQPSKSPVRPQLTLAAALLKLAERQRDHARRPAPEIEALNAKIQELERNFRAIQDGIDGAILENVSREIERARNETPQTPITASHKELSDKYTKLWDRCEKMDSTIDELRAEIESLRTPPAADTLPVVDAAIEKLDASLATGTAQVSAAIDREPAPPLAAQNSPEQPAVEIESQRTLEPVATTPSTSYDWPQLFDEAKRTASRLSRPDNAKKDYVQRLITFRKSLAESVSDASVQIVHLKPDESNYQIHEVPGGPAETDELVCPACQAGQSWQLAVGVVDGASRRYHILFPPGRLLAPTFPRAFSELFADPPDNMAFQIATLEAPARLTRLQSNIYKVDSKLFCEKADV
ncbi:MAG: hypothetical protein ACKV2U_32870 [Bryobacteraceae bacterium]